MTRDPTHHDGEGKPAFRLHTPPPAWVGDLIAGVFIVAAAFAPFSGEQFRLVNSTTILLAIAPAVVLPLRRRWPIPILVVCLVLYGIPKLLGILSLGATLGVAIAMFGVANRSNVRTTWIVGSITVVAIILLGLPAANANVADPRIVQFALGVAFASAAGNGARSRRGYIRAITQRAERAERTREAEAERRVSEERLRIARDLHDTVAHQIAVISLNAGVATSAIDDHPDRAREALGTIREASRTVLGEIGDLLTMLRSDDPGGDQRHAAPLHGLDQLGDLLEQFRTTGLDVHARIEADLSLITGTSSLVAYRVIQEGLTNAHKHGVDHRAYLLLDATKDSLRIVISNPTADSASAPRRSGPMSLPASGVGLLGLRERVASVRGTVHAGSVPGGWKLTAAIPLSKEGRT